MSFKREGDDVALLRNLKMRRVSELLGDNIPDDEASLLSNGRLCCMICNHRPIFDTIATLAVHRKGKKHIDELSKFLAHKKELEMKQLKADHYDYLKTERKLSQPVARQKNSKNGPSRLFSRKTVLDVPGLSTSEQGQKNSPSAQSQVRHYLKSLWKKRALEKTVQKLRENYGEGTRPPEKYECEKVENDKKLLVQSDKIGTTTTTTTTTKPELDETKMKKAEYNLQLRMSGWIKDEDGKWTKDPNVEFDSDENEPFDPPS
ncbi:sodium channel modifier 1 [Anabrus simplex]|uniref:sodium channel modifier 1 n=1 Tax=Anabrus simplex TaxID=316456 RepID=UPI0035A36413